MADAGYQHSTCTLFGPPPIPGLAYYPDFITEAEESALLAQIDAQPWNTDIKRRTQYYGSRYREDGSPSLNAGVLPPWLVPFAERLKARRIFALMPDRAGVNDYAPGCGIGAHRDQGGEVIEVVAIISLLAPIMFELTRIGHPTQEHWLQPRSLFVMQDEARHKWYHGIPARMSDRVGGLVVPRRRRVSVTFRCVGGAAAAPDLE
jgi:alkylated DNA repair dioxygenase AlkB